jgi:hypothetical protein
VAIPLEPLVVRLVFATRPTEAAQRREVTGEVVGEPLARLATELLVRLRT